MSKLKDGKLKDKVALVLGASTKGGFGEAIAKIYAAEGAKVVVAARSLEALKEIAAEVNGTAVPCDITDEKQLEQMVAKVIEIHGRLDIAVCVTGGHVSSPIAEMTAEKILPVVAMNIVGTTLFIKHVGKAISDGGSIIMISSLAAEDNRAGTSIYGGTKAALEKIVRVAGIEYGLRGIRVNSIAPGVVMTPMASAWDTPAILDLMNKATPLGKLATAESVAEAALYLASDHCATTGDSLRVSGGMHLTAMPSPAAIAAAAAKG